MVFLRRLLPGQGFGPTLPKGFPTNRQEKTHGRKKEIQWTKIRQGCGQDCEKRHAQEKARDIEVGSGRQGRHSEEPEAGDRDRALRGPQERCESAPQESGIAARWRHMLKLKSKRSPHLWKGLAAGLAGGLAGTIAMTQFQVGWKKATEAFDSGQ